MLQNYAIFINYSKKFNAFFLLFRKIFKHFTCLTTQGNGENEDNSNFQYKVNNDQLAFMDDTLLQ